MSEGNRELREDSSCREEKERGKEKQTVSRGFK